MLYFLFRSGSTTQYIKDVVQVFIHTSLRILNTIKSSYQFNKVTPFKADYQYMMEKEVAPHSSTLAQKIP